MVSNDNVQLSGLGSEHPSLKGRLLIDKELEISFDPPDLIQDLIFSSHPHQSSSACSVMIMSARWDRSLAEKARK